MISNGGVTKQAGSLVLVGNHTFAGGVTVNLMIVVGANNLTTTAPGVISGAGSITKVDIVGQLMVTSTVGAKYHIDVTSLTLGNVSGPVHDFNPTLDYDWVIAMVTSGVTGFNADFFQVNTSGFTNSFDGSFSVAQSGNGIILHYTAVPEPGSIALAGLAAASFYVRRRRAKRIA